MKFLNQSSTCWREASQTEREFGRCHPQLMQSKGQAYDGLAANSNGGAGILPLWRLPFGLNILSAEFLTRPQAP